MSACFVGGLTGLALAPIAHGGIVASLGFAVLGGLWLLTTALALRAVLMRDIDTHWRWMVRSFSLCFAAVTIRLYLGIYAGLDAVGLAGAPSPLPTRM